MGTQLQSLAQIIECIEALELKMRMPHNVLQPYNEYMQYKTELQATLDTLYKSLKYHVKKGLAA